MKQSISQYKDRLPPLLKKTAFVFLLLISAAPFLFRFIPPPFSMMMVYQKIVALTQGRSYDVTYQWTSLKNMSPSMGLAVIAAEDQKFMEHCGFDFESTWKAMRYRNKAKRVRGASSISQQTAKNLFLFPTKTLGRKLSEAYFTILIETIWSKKRILEVYLNIAEFGEGIYGVKAASKKFFNKTPDRLTSSESALLAAVLPNPHRFRVHSPSRYVLGRQRQIVSQMRALGGIMYISGLTGKGISN
ncbi:MAG: monofunctional biosynthetic peptidoglycan transglycosylase [Deltaproteobacteria bacterium]|nr:monofunctional biosynthetic peptidoglycan transglycosylase [Deltaproteobacteria bacterium]